MRRRPISPSSTCSKNSSRRFLTAYHDTQFLFLANIDPTLQAAVRREMDGVRMTGGDTMNFWITELPNELRETLKLVNVLLINDIETKMLARRKQPAAGGAESACRWGRRRWSIKHGEYGATIFFREGAFGIGIIRFARRRCRLRGQGSDGRGRFVRGRIYGLHRIAGRTEPRSVEARVVLRGSHGIVCRGGFGTERLQI